MKKICPHEEKTPLKVLIRVLKTNIDSSIKFSVYTPRDEFIDMAYFKLHSINILNNNYWLFFRGVPPVTNSAKKKNYYIRSIGSKTCF